MLSAVFIAAVLLAQAGPAAAPATTAPPAAAPPTVSSVVVQGQKSQTAIDNEVVCHKEQVLGTMFPKEVCARRADFAERRRVDQQTTRESTNLRPYDITSGLPH